MVAFEGTPVKGMMSEEGGDQWLYSYRGGEGGGGGLGSYLWLYSKGLQFF